MLYTQQTCMYPRLNSALRDHMNPEKLAPFLPYFKLLLTALYKLPLLSAQTYRTVKLDLHELYNQLEGKVFTWWAFSSSTLLDDLYKGSVNDRTMFIIDAIGVDISAFSAHPDEQEVLLLPGTPLMVKPGVKVETGYWKFEASVLSATQHKRRQQNTDEETLDHLPSADDSGMSKLRFQNIDFPHPHWEKVVLVEGIQISALLSLQPPP